MDTDNYTIQPFTEHGTRWRVCCVLVCASFPATEPQHDGGGVVVYVE